MTPILLQPCIFFRFPSLRFLRQKASFIRAFTSEKKKWLGAESNRRHVDFQSTALPTELPSRDNADRVTPWGVHYATM